MTRKLERLLKRTSRTFALNIPFLPEPTRSEVAIAYLLFRIADTFEDSVLWAKDVKAKALDDFVELLKEPDSNASAALAASWTAPPPLDHDGYVELLSETEAVMYAFGELRAEARATIADHVVRTAEGMKAFVLGADDKGVLQLTDLTELKHYCYIVAGIVGEMLTELFMLGRPGLLTIRDDLRGMSADFGEGLQLTNILKDVEVDAGEGRQFLSEGIIREEVFGLARRDLDTAVDYTLALQEAGAERGLVLFNAIPVALARATVDAVAAKGPGAKIPRPQLWAIVSRVEKAIDKGAPVLDRGSAAKQG